ncbi:hypothetical protein GOBAR_DD05638 [Gossypium barbadense]|nr:hypothetical protein GOBAR_DD05638 [Gossypium barbadense]
MGIMKFDDPSRPNVAEKRPKEMRSYCEFRAEGGHEIQECVEFKTLLQSLMDNKELEFFKKVKGPEGMLGNLNDNAVSEEGAGEENLSCIYPYKLGSALDKSDYRRNLHNI